MQQALEDINCLKKMKIIHDNNNEKYACNEDIKTNPGQMSLLQERVTCIDCLELIIKEWERQIKHFSGQPQKNAKEGLKLAKKLLSEIKQKEE